jgi:ferredoxin-NADP reductase
VTAPRQVGGITPWREAVIERIERRTSRVVSLFLRAPIGPSEAGQHVDVRLTAPDGYQAQRSYSIASAPGEPLVELAVERLEDGEVSPYFADVAQVGDTIEVRGPLGGHFVWRPEDGGPLLLLAGGSGIAPLMSILRHRARTAPLTDAMLVYSSRTWEEVIFREELLLMDAEVPRVDVIVTTTREGRHRPTDLERRLDGEALRMILARWGMSPAHAYVCGSTPFVEKVANALVDEGVSPDRVKTERYGGVV